jgi:hypothetical protein
MKRILVTLAGAAVVGALPGALGVSAAYAQPLNCKPPQHCIQVSVDASTHKLTVDVETLKKSGPGHHVHWTLVNGPGQSYTFPADGIMFASADGGAQVFKCHLDAKNAHVFHCADPTGKKGTYKYTVTVSGQPNPGALDPRIINN